MPKVSKPRKHGDRWEINWTDGTGKRRFQTFLTHKEAVEALRGKQAEADLARAGVTPQAPPSHSFEELIEQWKVEKHAKRSLKDDEGRIRIHLQPAFGGLALIEITAPRITRFKRDLARRVQVQTARHVLGLLRGMLRFAVHQGWLVAAPRVQLPTIEERDYQWLRTEDEMRRLLEAAQAHSYTGLFELYATALYTGMRAGELAGLRWSDVDLDRRLITVQRSFDKPAKSKKIRRVPIVDPLLPVLRAWKLRGASAELVFPNERGNMHVSNARAMHQIFHACLESAEIARIRFHDLRHTFASHYMLRGGSLFKLQKILGHSSIVMTQRYAHLSPEAFQEDWGRLGDVRPQEREGKVVPLTAAQAPGALSG